MRPTKLIALNVNKVLFSTVIFLCSQIVIMTETHHVLTDVAHCLKRPDMFIGSVVPQELKYWRFVAQNDTYVVEPATTMLPPAFSQLFLEIATNATDHAARPLSQVKNIRVTMDDATGRISVENDGSGIDIRFHTQFPDKYLPTIIFSEFRCGQNFDDAVERKGAGRNGYGAKCTNAWSTEFEVETVSDNQQFLQRWSNNMSHVTAPRITKAHRKPFTRISFIPDYARLHITDIPGALQYLRTFVWHLCPVTDPKLQIWLDGAKLPVRNLKDYAKMLSLDGTVLYEEANNMQIAVIPARTGIEGSIGFVNGIPCSTGTHVNYVLNRLTQQAPDIQPAVIKAHTLLLVNATVINPTFTSQTKEQLSLDMRRSGASWEPSVAFIKNFKKSAIFDAIKEEQDLRETRKAKSAAGKGTSMRARYVQVDGYESAMQAGNPKRTAPTSIILTEGDSAKGFAISGLSVIGRDNYGVFPLRGKLKNVRGEKLSTILQTAEIANILKILGVDMSARTPQNTRELRYDRVIILTDQDVDGAHIAGLIINALLVLIPDVFKHEPTFVQRFATPLVRAIGKSATWPNHEFMTEREYQEWHDSNLTLMSHYTVKYYKGLGTSTPKDAKICFQNIDKYLITIDCQGAADQELLVDFFDSKRAGRRKELLMQPSKDVVDYTQARVSLEKFLMSELLEFSRYNNERSLAHVIDGFKPAQRKIMWTMLTSAVGSIKVAQLSGEVAKRTHYKHGENSLNETIIKMAQDFPLSGNNINLLVPDGMFGNRHGDEAASPRYIYTKAEPIAKALFPSDDYPVLEMLQQEGDVIEPLFMVPILPLVLINGTSGIGSGFSSDVPPFNPVHIISWIRGFMDFKQGRAPAPIFDAMPHWEGFYGNTEKRERGVVLYGKFEVPEPRQVVVTDLPRATNDFRFNSKKDDAFCQAYPHQCIVANTDVNVHLTFVFEQEVTPELVDKLKARAQMQIDMTNMTLWGPGTSYPVLYKSIQDILMQHAETRLAFNARRKEYQIAELKQNILRAQEEYRFICRVMDEPMFLMRQSQEAVLKKLEAERFQRINGSFDHLLRLPVSSMTKEMLDKLKKQTDTYNATLKQLEAQTIFDIWRDDLAKFEAAYVRFLEERAERRALPVHTNPKADAKAAPIVGKNRKRKLTDH